MHSFVHAFFHSFMYSFTHSLIHAVVHSFIHSLTDSLTLSFIHPCILSSLRSLIRTTATNMQSVLDAIHALLAEKRVSGLGSPTHETFLAIVLHVMTLVKARRLQQP
jgi:hypothetical protein